MHTVLLVLSDSQKPAKRHITPLSVFSHLKPCLYLRGAAKAKNAPKNCGATGMQHAQTTLHAYNGERGHTAANTKGDQTRLRPARFAGLRGVLAQRVHSVHMLGRNWGFLLLLAIFLPL